MQKKKEQYEITPEVVKEISSYCEGLLTLMNNNFFEKYKIYENEFLEYLFASCELMYKETGSFKVSSQEIVNILSQKKFNDEILERISSNNGILKKVDKDSSLFFEFFESQS